ncbi:MAG: hypothetical protein RL693_1852, partial [Verrucomicrobiota bacterium]
FPNCPIRLHYDGIRPSPRTTPEAYEGFCTAIEELDATMSTENPWGGAVVGSAMFDIMGGQWRKYVKNQFL